MRGAVLDLTRLVKVCGRLGSTHDGEVLSAARTAERLRQQAGLTWADLLQPAPGQARTPSDDWRQACRFCLGHFERLTSWEMHFVSQLLGYRATPSPKQQDILERLVERCRQTD